VGVVDQLDFGFMEVGAVAGRESEGVARDMGAGDFAEAGDFDDDAAGLLGEGLAAAGEALAKTEATIEGSGNSGLALGQEDVLGGTRTGRRLNGASAR